MRYIICAGVMTRFENAAKSVYTSERERARKHFFLSTFQNEANKEVERESTGVYE
jgi:hypothetical protein